FSTAGSFADKIGPTDEDANVVRKETDTVTLKCSYESNSDYIRLYWYRQYPNSAPKFLLLKGAKSSRSDDYNPSGSRFRAETTSDATELIIKDLQISDSALYHCALRVGAAQLKMIVLFSMTGDSMADSIETLFPHKAVDEGDDVTLSCKYKKTTSVSNLQWYKQYPKSRPKFLLYILPSGDTSSLPPRLNATVKNEQVDLIISSAAVSDSALYYCALVPTVTGNPAALYKNLYMVFHGNVFIAEAADISIKPEETTLSVTEGSNITLSCTYTGSVNRLHCYQQKPGSRPGFLLLIDEDSEYVREAQPPHPRLSIKLDKMFKKIKKKVDLHISSAAVSDSALYYCALTPTVTGNPTPLNKKHYM
ncbi:hypothetical protein HF521_019028, partial [Silurus meridionalis]